MSKLLQVNDLTTEFTGDFGKKISVDHVSFDVAEGETVCIVGESGCGKSVTSLSIMGLLGRGGAVVDGSVLFANKNLLDMDEKQLDTIRGNQMTMIFQDPLTSLNPVFTIGSQITDNGDGTYNVDVPSDGSSLDIFVCSNSFCNCCKYTVFRNMDS